MAIQNLKDLTPRQQETLDWIKEFIQKHSVPPTVREIGRAFHIKSSSVFDLLQSLVRKGYLRRSDMGTRSLILEGQNTGAECGCGEIPVVGMVAAGQFIEALEVDYGTISVDKSILRGGKAHALKVKGDSMIDANILNGDYVVIREQDTADTGDIVVALKDGEATLKYFYRERNRIRLEPANKKMSPIYVKAGDFKIQGKVVGVMRFMAGDTAGVDSD